jgi:hypothetical protein
MSVYIYQRDLQLYDVDPSSQVRHSVPVEFMSTLDRNYIHKVQERFHELGFGYMVGNINGCFNTKLYGTILAFQQQALLPRRRKKDFVDGSFSLEEVPISFSGSVNGIFDSETAKEVDLWLRKGYVNSCDKPLVPIGKTWAREDVAAAISRVRRVVVGRGGVFPELSFACFRHPAGTLEMPGRKKESLHCVGIAIDLDEWRGAQSQEDDFFFVDRDEHQKWVVYVRSRSSKVPLFTIQVWYFDWRSRCFRTKEVQERLINLSFLLEEAGLRPIHAISGWEESYYLSEWWHFQKEEHNDWFTEMRLSGFSPEYLRFLGYGQE